MTLQPLRSFITVIFITSNFYLFMSAAKINYYYSGGRYTMELIRVHLGEMIIIVNDLSYSCREIDREIEIER